MSGPATVERRPPEGCLRFVGRPAGVEAHNESSEPVRATVPAFVPTLRPTLIKKPYFYPLIESERRFGGELVVLSVRVVPSPFYTDTRSPIVFGIPLSWYPLAYSTSFYENSKRKDEIFRLVSLPMLIYPRRPRVISYFHLAGDEKATGNKFATMNLKRSLSPSDISLNTPAFIKRSRFAAFIIGRSG